MTMRRFEVTPVTDSGGAATYYTPYVSGYVHTVEYVIDGTIPYTSGAVDMTITAEATGETILTATDVSASFVKAPRQPIHSTAGVAALYAAAGTAVFERIGLGRDRIKIVIAQGGNAKQGRFIFLVAD